VLAAILLLLAVLRPAASPESGAARQSWGRARAPAAHWALQHVRL